MLRPVRTSHSRAIASMPPDAASAPSSCRGGPARCGRGRQPGWRWGAGGGHAQHGKAACLAAARRRRSPRVGRPSRGARPRPRRRPAHLEGQGVHRPAVALLLQQALPRLHVPQPPRLVIAGGACGGAVCSGSSRGQRRERDDWAGATETRRQVWAQPAWPQRTAVGRHACLSPQRSQLVLPSHLGGVPWGGRRCAPAGRCGPPACAAAGLLPTTALRCSLWRQRPA